MVTDLRRATLVLDVISKGRGSLTVTDLTARTGLPRSSVHRVVQALEHEQYVKRVPGRIGYALGPRLLNFGINAHLSMLSANRAKLMTLSRAVGEETALAILSAGSVVVIDQVPVSHQSSNVIDIGRRFPLHASSFGKALLSRLPDEHLQSLIAGPLPQLTTNTVVDPGVLLRQLDTIRRFNIAIDTEEHRAGVCGLATATDAPTGGLQAIAVVIPAPRMRQKLGVAIAALHRLNPSIDVTAAKKHYLMSR